MSLLRRRLAAERSFGVEQGFLLMAPLPLCVCKPHRLNNHQNMATVNN
jgi:hypothetical protein